MKRKEILFFLLFLLLIPQNLKVKAQDIFTVDLITAIEFAITNNQELHLTKREEILLEKKEKGEGDSFQIRFSSNPQLLARNGEVIPEFRPGITLIAKKGILGGTLSGNLATTIDVTRDNELESTLIISFLIPILDPSRKEVQVPAIYQREKENLVESVITTFHALLLLEKEIDLLVEKVRLEEMRVKASHLTKEDEMIKESVKRLEEMEKKLTEARRILDSQKRIFQDLLAIEEEILPVLDPHLLEIKEPFDLTYWQDIASENHPSIIEAQKNLKEAEKREGFFHKSGWSVNLNTGLEPYQISSEITDPTFFIQLQAQTIFSSMSSLEREEEELREERASLEFRKASQIVQKQVERSYFEFLEALATIENERKDLAKSQKNLAILENKYNLGLIGPIQKKEELLHHQQQEYAFLAALSRSHLRYLDLQKASGLSIIPQEVMEK